MGESTPLGLAAEKVWERFEEAAYEYAQGGAFREFEKEGYVGPPGDLSWASEHLPAFVDSLDEEVLEEVLNLDGNYVLEEAQYRFVVAFREGWHVASPQKVTLSTSRPGGWRVSGRSRGSNGEEHGN